MRHPNQRVPIKIIKSENFIIQIVVIFVYRNLNVHFKKKFYNDVDPLHPVSIWPIPDRLKSWKTNIECRAH